MGLQAATVVLLGHMVFGPNSVFRSPRTVHLLNRPRLLYPYPVMAQFILVENATLQVRFPYSEKKVQALKRLPVRNWNKEKECWEIPVSLLKEACEALGQDFETVPRSIRDAFEREKKAAIRIAVENSKTKIEGPDLPIEEIDEVTSFWVEGAEFSQLYRKGRWDGHKHLMTKRGNLIIPTGLLPSVIEVLKRAGLNHSIQDKRKKPKKAKPLKTHGHDLRDYQQEVLKSTAKKERGILQLATGAGKTLIGAHVIAQRGLKSLFFVHTKDLLYQAMGVLEEVLNQPIGQIGDGKVEIQDITVATIQTTARALHLKLSKEKSDEVPLWGDEAGESLTVSDEEAIREALKDAQMVLFDECHHLPADTFYDIAMKIPNAYYRYGLSATPWRSDHSDLMIEAALGKKLCAVTSTDLIERGYLVKPKITMFEILPTGRRLRRHFATVYKSEVVENETRNQIIAEVARHSSQRGRSVLILVNQIRHGEILEEMIPESTFISGNDSSEVRHIALQRLRSKADQVLIATTLADEGLDLPSLDVLILAGAGRSETRALQRVGRVLRPHPDKTTATIVDFWDQTLYLQEHSKARHEIYSTEPGFDVEIRPPKIQGPKTPRQRILSEN
ncbi:MAG: DEAD/DEAH box helicase [Candidatus Omnitrophica bacterium]|nr:DEAD/DEAH box helicase [Candidatus Omnitrophota bacterium]